MNKNVVIGIVLALVVVSVFVVLVVSYTGKGNSLASAVTSGSCAGTSSCSPQQMAAGCGSGSAGCSTAGKSSCGGGSSPYYDPNVDYGKIEREAVAFYSQKTGDTSVMAKAFGIGNINVVIYKNKQILEQFKYDNGKFVK